MARLNEDNVVRARKLIGLYPHHRSALIPLLHLLQAQDGYVSPDGMEHLAELLDLTPAEVRGTASFYEMLHLEPVGRYLVAVCTNIACMLAGAYELVEHMEQRLGVPVGGTSSDGLFTLEEAECLALCGNAPCLVVNWRYFGDMTPDRWDHLAADLAAGRLAGEVPPHGTLCRVQRAVELPAAGQARSPADQAAKPAPPAQRGTQPAPRPAALDSAGQEVELATSLTTTAVASTLYPGGQPSATEDDAK
ncbi:MAG TPA: NAD(P)H-dependent oxidoreductase subunit E [Acidimicrobiales bacterium]|nr:NAD(P)H-dependent oxidoreductase subunit E [Acidimicrobiales bacterium]